MTFFMMVVYNGEEVEKADEIVTKVTELKGGTFIEAGQYIMDNGSYRSIMVCSFRNKEDISAVSNALRHTFGEEVEVYAMFDTDEIHIGECTII